jgi:hypothetical protein
MVILIYYLTLPRSFYKVSLRQLKTKNESEFVYNLIDIFSVFGVPCILQSDNGRNFENHIKHYLVPMYVGWLKNSTRETMSFAKPGEFVAS